MSKKHETIAFRASLPIRETNSNTAVTKPESDLLHSIEQNVRFLSCGVPLMELPTSDSRPLALARNKPTTLVTHGRKMDGCADAASLRTLVWISVLKALFPQKPLPTTQRIPHRSIQRTPIRRRIQAFTALHHSNRQQYRELA